MGQFYPYSFMYGVIFWTGDQNNVDVLVVA